MLYVGGKEMDVLTLEVPRTSSLSKAKKIEAHHFSNAGLVLAGIAVAPLLAFAFVWAMVLAMLGGMWLLDLVGLL